MTPRQYITGLTALIIGVFTIPSWIIEPFRVYVVSVITIVTIAWNMIFTWEKFHAKIVSRIFADVMIELFKTDEFRAIMGKKSIEKIRTDEGHE